jgi:hypothetical protein
LGVTVAKSPVTGESAKEAVKTIVQGKPDDPATPVVTTVCFLPMHTGRGCELSTRLSLRPLSLGQNFLHSSGASRREKAGAHLRGCLKNESIRVIPGRAIWRAPGIHTPGRGHGFRVRDFVAPRNDEMTEANA